MSAEALYQAVKSGSVKLEDLNDDGVNALKSYMSSSFPDLMKPEMSRQEFTQQTGIKTSIPTVQDIPIFQKMQQDPLPTTTYNPGVSDNTNDSKWNNVLDNPIVHGAETALRWASKPFETISTGIADATGAIQNEFGTHTVKGFDGNDITLSPSEHRNVAQDVKNIWSKTDSPPVSSQAWQGALPNLGIMPGTDKQWTDVIDFGAQMIGPGEIIKPLKYAGKIGELTESGAARKAFKELIEKMNKTEPLSAYDAAAVNAKYAEQGAPPAAYNVPNAQAGSISDRLRFVDQQVNGNGVLGLPESRGERLMKEAKAQANQVGDGVIYGPGRTVYDDPKTLADTFGLPAGNYVKPERLKIAGNEETLNLVMQKIKPIVTERMTPPLENPTELARYVQQHVGTSMNELRRLPYDDLVDLAKDVSRNMDMYDMSVQAARELGYDLPKLLEGRGQGLSERITADAQKRAYGVYPERVPIKSPEAFNSQVLGEAAAPREAGWAVKRNGSAAMVDVSSRSEVERQLLAAAEQRPPIRQRSVNGRIPEGVQAMQVGSQESAASRMMTAEEPTQIHSTGDESTQQFSGSTFPFRNAIVQNERTISRTDLVNNIKKRFPDVPIDAGRLGKVPQGVRGFYKVNPEVVRTLVHQDIQAIAHEMGHHLDKKYSLQVNNPTIRRELSNLMQQSGLNMSAYTPAQLDAEGVAEFLRTYMTDPQKALRIAPNYARMIEGALPKKVWKAIQATERDIDTWITQGPENQAMGLLDFDTEKPKPKLTWDRWYTKFTDDLNPLKLAEKALTTKVGYGKDSIYKMAMLSRGVAERAKLAVTRGIYINGVKVSEGLQEIIKPLEEAGINEKEFSTYLAVKHAEDLNQMGKRVPFDDTHIQAILQKYDTPLMQDAQQKIIKFNNALLDILVDAGLKSADDVKFLRDKYPNYVPFQRYFDEDVEAGFKNGGYGASSAFANISDPVKRMSEEGSYRTIMNPIESMVKNAFLTMNAAAKNKVGLQLAELSKIEGSGKWLEAVPGGKDAHGHILNVWKNGERQALKINDPDLYNAMLSLDTESANSFVKFLGGVAGILRGGATLTPEFMARNAMRDFTEAFIKTGLNPVDYFKGLFHVLGRTEMFDKFLSEGGALGTMMSLDRTDLKREAMAEIFRKSLYDKTMNVITSPRELAKMFVGYTPAKAIVNVLRKGAEVSELSTKVGRFQKVYNKTGDLQEAAYQARDLMDFNRAGSAVRQANRMVAFLNASIQGTDGMVRAFKQDKAGFLLRSAIGLVMPAVLIHYLNDSLPPDMKEEYDNIPQWQKDSFFVIGIPGTGKFARIPKPFEAGTLFATGTERTLRWFHDNDPEAYKHYGSALMESFTPPTMITMLTPLLEAITNYSFFRGGPIVSQGDQRFEKKDQYGINTSEVSKYAGKAMDAVGLGDSNFASPKIIDNTLYGYTGGLGRYVVDGLDTAIRMVGGGDGVPKPAKHAEDLPLARSFLASTSGGGQVRTDFYDKWDQLSTKKASADKNEEPFADPEYSRMRSSYNAISKLNKQYKIIQKDKNMKSSDKRSQLDELDDKINEIAAQGLGRK